MSKSKMLNVRSYILYKSPNNKLFNTIFVNEASGINSDSFCATQLIKRNDFSDDYTIDVKLKETISLSITLRLMCTLEENDSVIQCSDLIQFFTHKSLSPVLKLIITDQQSFVIHANRNYPVVFRKFTPQSFTLDFILDAPYMHPSWEWFDGIKKSAAAPVQTQGTEYLCRFSIIKLKEQEEFVPVMPMIYPNAHSAGFIFTDHCDFDTAQKLRLFLYGNNNDGWLNKNLKITKGVFTLSSKSREFNKNDSLEEENYSTLINKLYEDGSEIVPHALKSKGQLDSKTFYVALKKISSEFHPRTWIDHGSYLKYCYSQGGKYNPDYLLAESLKKYNYNNLWSFHDVYIDALNTLNIFTKKKNSNIRIEKKIAEYIIKGKWMIAAHFFRSIWHRNYKRNIVFDFIIYAMARSKGSFIQWKKNKVKVFSQTLLFFKALVHFKKRRDKEALPYSIKDVLLYSDAVFLEERRPLAQYKDGDLLMFSSFETTHVKDIYTPAALDKLIDEYGLHIGHTYILNDLPYLNNIFDKENGKMVLSPQWKKFTDVLSSNSIAGKIWNPSMGEFVGYLTALLKVEISYLSGTLIRLWNDNISILTGFTLIIPLKYKNIIRINDRHWKAIKTDAYFHFFTFDLPSQEYVFVSFL
jgi:hypothetical protein